jgi:hypothetical protein
MSNIGNGPKSTFNLIMFSSKKDVVKVWNEGEEGVEGKQILFG